METIKPFTITLVVDIECYARTQRQAEQIAEALINLDDPIMVPDGYSVDYIEVSDVTSTC